jgi:hypothetical protein
MKKYRIFDKLFMSLGFLTAGISSFIDYKEGEPFIWQLSCMVWISVAYIKQLSIESMEDEE